MYNTQFVKKMHTLNLNCIPNMIFIKSKPLPEVHNIEL